MLQHNNRHLSYITTNYELHYDKPQVTLRQTIGYITTNYRLHYDKLVLTLRVNTSPLPPKKFSLVDVQREKFSFSSQKSRAKI